MLVVAGTGHRPDKLGGYDDRSYERVFKTACIAIREQCPDCVISGMALGWDMALAEAAYCLGVHFYAYVPFEGQESKWPEKSKILYRNLLAKAVEVKCCSEPGYDPHKMQVRNQMMVDDSQLLLALWDGSSGGTKNCLDYARRVGREVVNYWGTFSEAT